MPLAYRYAKSRPALTAIPSLSPPSRTRHPVRFSPRLSRKPASTMKLSRKNICALWRWLTARIKTFTCGNDRIFQQLETKWASAYRRSPFFLMVLNYRFDCDVQLLQIVLYPDQIALLLDAVEGIDHL